MCGALWRAWPAAAPLLAQTRGRGVLFHPERMVERHGRAPVGHREAGLDPLRLSELFGRVVEFETVKEERAAEEMPLRPGRARRGEIDAPEISGRLPRRRAGD